jgi:hypothetical protein
VRGKERARVFEEDFRMATGDFCCIQMRDNEGKRDEENTRRKGDRERERQRKKEK